MTATLLDGRALAADILENLKPQVAERNPRLVIVQVGNNPASTAYVRKKLHACLSVGMRHDLHHLPEDASLSRLMDTVGALNEDSDVTGYMVQLPLPRALQPHESEVLGAILPSKDVDGLTAHNLGRTMHSREQEQLAPATPAGIIRLLEQHGIEIRGKIAVVVGQGIVVGKPMSAMLKNRGATTVNCDIDTPVSALRSIARGYGDLLITAVGRPGLITPEMIKPGAVVIDAGIKREGDRLLGDVGQFEEVRQIASSITPVPGGVGPMTIACLLENVVKAEEMRRGEGV